MTRAGRSWLNIADSSGEADGGDQEVEQLDADKRGRQPAQAVDQQVAAEQGRGT
jgi:hypothetical protein